jgi:hypothetical protein
VLALAVVGAGSTSASGQLAGRFVEDAAAERFELVVTNDTNVDLTAFDFSFSGGYGFTGSFLATGQDTNTDGDADAPISFLANPDTPLAETAFNFDPAGLLAVEVVDAVAGPHVQFGGAFTSLSGTPLLGAGQSATVAFFQTSDGGRPGLASGSSVVGQAATSGGQLWDILLTAQLLADYDANGEVGAGDLALVLSNWGHPIADGQAPDANWAHTASVTAPNIGADELALVLSSWGDTSAVDASLADITAVTGLDRAGVIALVPEPGTLGLLGGLLGLGLARRRA